jgi:chromosome segregation protein
LSIEYLRLKGFKSFGTSCEFSFSEGLTAIVGPNGSGKSNILDALRWVLGEGSPGTLRIVRQSDLIFQGSASVDPSKEADVVLKLKRKESAAEMTSTLRRHYTVESGSVLQVDDVKIRLQDLADFKACFMLKGDAFAFIGQGEVSETIHQRPMERRRHLEVLFGIDYYRKRREETDAKLENNLVEMQRISTLISELEIRREEISPEVAIAVEAKGILDNLENVRRDFYFSRRLFLEKQEQEHRSKLQLAAEQRDLVKRWRDLWSRSVSKGEEKLRIDGFDEQAFLTREREMITRKETLRRQSFSVATQVKGILSSRRDLEAERKRVFVSMDSVKTELEKTQNEEMALAHELEMKRAALEDALRHLEESRAEVERERMRRQILQDEYAEKTLSRSKLEARLKALSASQDESSKDLSRLKNERAALDATIAKLEQEVGVLEKQHEKLSLEHSGVYAICQKYAANLQQARRELGAREAELDAIKENTEASIYPRPTQFLLSAARLGRMNSKPEVVAESFSCPPEIASALEAYLGGRQFWLLVHTLDEAQEGIELLKKQRVGRATYLPLERCRPRSPDFRYRLPVSGVVGWCIELITPRSPWETALQHLLGDLLVVSDYALGSSLVKSGAKFPISTLDGEVFSPTGTVSGGRTQQSEGAISHNQRVTELSVQVDALKQKIGGLESELTRAEKQEQKVAQERDELGARAAQSKNEFSTSQRALAGLISELERLGQEKSSSEAEIALLETELSALGVRIAELETQVADLQELAESGRDSLVGAIRSEVELVEERLKGTANVLGRIRREYGDLGNRVVFIGTELETGCAEEQNLKKQLARMGREQFAAWKEIREINATLDAERRRIDKFHNRLERLRAREQKAENDAVALAAEIAALNERIASTRAEAEQLQELWGEKYPYDVHEAAKIEAARIGEGRESAARDLTAVMRRLERELRTLGNYNLGALSEDESLIERIDYLSEQSEDVRTGIDELKKLIAETDSHVETVFTRDMNDIDDRFNALFQRLFNGGEARLILQEEGTIWDKGVEIHARPPGKHLQNISQLSGGEQSLTAIAHLFAALEVARMPLAVLDEVDAALDEYNLIRFADLAKEYSKRLQLLVMTHRRTTMERADLIYGVTMVEAGLSKIVGIDVENYK